MSVVNRSTSAPSPLSPKRWPAEAFSWWRSLLFAAIYVITYLVPTAILSAYLVARYGRFSLTTIPLGLVIIIQLVTYIPQIAVLLALLPALARRSLRQLGLRVPDARELAWGIGGAIAMVLVATTLGAIEQNVLHVHVQETAVDLLRGAHGEIALGFAFLAVIAAPFVEELTFRGFVFNALLRYLPAVLAGVLSAILFGLAHLDPRSPSAVVPLAGGGLVLAWVYYRSGSLVSSMITHGGFNLLTVVGVLVFHVK
jgi:membrane protease YdiL (CAAX protease family)